MQHFITVDYPSSSAHADIEAFDSLESAVVRANQLATTTGHTVAVYRRVGASTPQDAVFAGVA